MRRSRSAAVHALVDGSIAAARRRGARPARRERCRQVDAGEDPRRRPPARRRRAAHRRRADGARRAGGVAARPGSRSSTRSRRCSPTSRVAENIFMGRQPLSGGRRIDRGAMNAAAAEVFARLGVALDPTRPARGLSVADQQIVEIAKAISFDARVHRDGRADGGADRRRGRAAVRRHAHAARRGRRRPVHLATGSRRCSPSASGSRSCATARFVRTDPIEDLDDRRRSSARWSAATSTRCSPRPTPTPGEVVLEVERPDAATGCSTTSRSRSAAARSSPSPGWSAPGAARSPGRSSASTATTPDGRRSTASRCRAASPIAAMARRRGLRARGPPPAGPGHGPGHRPQRGAGLAAAAAARRV